jgi:ATP-dependent DNA helicase RecG
MSMSPDRAAGTSIGWEAKLAAVAGRHAATIEKAFGYRTVGDLLQHYPRKWVDKGRLSDLGDIEPGEIVTVIARVVSATPHTYRDRRTGRPAHRLDVVVATEDHRLRLAFFDRQARVARWRQDHVAAGRVGLFAGKVSTFRGQLQLTHPETDMVEDGSETEGAELMAAEWDMRPQLIALYPATASVQSWQLARAIALALDLVDDVPETLPEKVRLERGLLPAAQAIEGLHRPKSREQLEAAVERLRFDEAFVAQTVLAQRREVLRIVGAEPRRGREGGLLDRFDARLPFRLTAGQQEVGRVVLEDLAAEHPMHRLLQGEVGSGKTVVALRGMLRVVDSGGQAALLAPTEVLAQQHHRSITGLLGDLAAGGMLGGADDGTRVALLTGSMGAGARRQALADVASGVAGIVVGTHALLEERVQFADLGLVVVDEQHRFGVEQRAALADKSGATPPHVLVMTATPIPRTVAMTVFGDLETSTLRELPAGRAPIQTSVVPTDEHPSWLERAFERIREEVERGHQVYVVCPRIGDDDPQPGDPAPGQAPPAASVEKVAPMLADGPLHGLRVDMLHGRMPADRKDAVMRSFAAGDVDVLVCTTVIEVGVDVPNATMMLVLDADRFGVSQLHQLRGRVGRGKVPSLCLLVTEAPERSSTRNRVEAVASTTDGFELSRVDLEQRREGDVLGASQSGKHSHLRLLSLLRDAKLITDARAEAAELVADDPSLSRHPALAASVAALVDEERAEYLEKG